MKKRVLLTGADGFVGMHSIKNLLENEYEVHAVSLNDISLGQQESSLFWHQCDLLDRDQQKELIEQVKPTHLLHFAWVTTPGEYWASTDNIKWIQSSLELLLNFVNCGGKRALFAGTCAEYDWGFNGAFLEEGAPLNPTTLYGASKKCVQQILTVFSKQLGISSAWGRIFFSFGMHENPKRLVPTVISSILKGKTVKCTHGEQIRDFLFVKDTAAAFVSLLESSVEGPVNIASGKPVSLRSIIEFIAANLGQPEFVEFGALPTPKDDPAMLVANVDRLVKEVGWTPKYSLEEGLIETINWGKRTHE